MTAKEYYKSTRMVETRNWTLEMALNFAEDYAEALRKHDVSGRSEQFICPCGKIVQRCRPTPCPTNGIIYCEDCIMGK